MYSLLHALHSGTILLPSFLPSFNSLLFFRLRMGKMVKTPREPKLRTRGRLQRGGQDIYIYIYINMLSVYILARKIA
jgi:hypothetical protein